MMVHKALTKNLLQQDGEAYYYPDYIPSQASLVYFQRLKENILWKHESIKIFGRDIMQPRLTSWYGDSDIQYTYSSRTMTALPWNEDLLKIKNNLERDFSLLFNGALLNLYRNGEDSMGWHSDNEKELGTNPVIASLSFGEPRRFKLKHRNLKALKTDIFLENGSLLIMKGSTQEYWQHSLPKTKKAPGERINITFRYIQESTVL